MLCQGQSTARTCIGLTSPGVIRRQALPRRMRLGGRTREGIKGKAGQLTSWEASKDVAYGSNDIDESMVVPDMPVADNWLNWRGFVAWRCCALETRWRCHRCRVGVRCQVRGLRLLGARGLLKGRNALGCHLGIVAPAAANGGTAASWDSQKRHKQTIYFGLVREWTRPVFRVENARSPRRAAE